MNGNAAFVTLDDAERYELSLANKRRDGEDGWPEPLPLVRPLDPPEPFPVEALKPVLGNAASGIADLVQCPVGIAACSVLAVASLAAQPHVDVIHPATERRIPVSLFLMSIAESGERKSAADAEALAPVRRHEKMASDEYKLALSRWRNQHEAWDAARAAVKKKVKADRNALERELQALGEEPKRPAKPYITVTEPTFEGLQKLFAEGQPSMGLFSAEGGGFLGGHAMRDETRLRALTGLSELWDGSPLKRTRAGDEATQLPGRRLALHLMVQPSVAPKLLADDMAAGQGFLSRLLVCAPQSLQGMRFQKQPQEWARPAIDVYSQVIMELLQKKPRTLADNELDPLPMELTDEARTDWCTFADDMECGLAREGLSPGVRGLRNKTAEMALRIAGVLAVIDGIDQISQSVFQRGAVLAEFFLGEACRLYDAAAVSPEIGRAIKLVRWMIERRLDSVSVRDIQVHGPAALRESKTVKNAAETLESHGLCRIVTEQTGGRPSNRLILSPFAKGVIS